MINRDVITIVKGVLYTAFVICIAACAISSKNSIILGWYLLLLFLDVD